MALYAAFCVPLESEVVATEGGFAATVKVSGCDAFNELASVTCTLKLLLPVPVGVPEIIPVLGASVSPAGKVPESIDQV